MTERNRKRYDPEYRDIKEIGRDKKRSSGIITEVLNKRWKWGSAEEIEQEKNKLLVEVKARWAAKTDEERASEIARPRRMRLESNTQHVGIPSIHRLRRLQN